MKRKELVQMLFVIENYIIRRFVCGVPSNQLNKIFPPIFFQMQKIEEDSYLLKLKKHYRRKIILRTMILGMFKDCKTLWEW